MRPDAHSASSLRVSEIRIENKTSLEEVLFTLSLAGTSKIISMSKTRKIIATMKNWLLNGGLLSLREENPHSNSDFC